MLDLGLEFGLVVEEGHGVVVGFGDKLDAAGFDHFLKAGD